VSTPPESPERNPTPERNPSATHDPAAALSGTELRLAVFRLTRRLRSRRPVGDLSSPQLSVLFGLEARGPLSLGELAARDHVSAPSMHRTVNCLEEDGWVTREPDPDDGRKIRIVPTEAGIGAVRRTVKERDAWLQEAVDALPEEDRAVLAAAVHILDKLVRA